jgi:hypothetical protein
MFVNAYNLTIGGKIPAIDMSSGLTSTSPLHSCKIIPVLAA